MDSRSFDEITKALAIGASRRTVLKSLAAGIAAALLGPLLRRGGAARQQTCRDDGDCPSLSRCCGGVCRDVPNDPEHCGGCDSPCPPGPSMICCDGLCADAATSRNHCGQCDNSCGDGACIGGECCPAAAVCNGSCCAAGEVCLPPATPTAPNPSTPTAGDDAAPASRGICCPPRRLCADVCCDNGQECVRTEPNVACCATEFICNAGAGSLECCVSGTICVPGEGCKPRVAEDRRSCVPRGGQGSFRRSIALPGSQDVQALCEEDADCCEEGDVCFGETGECCPPDLFCGDVCCDPGRCVGDPAECLPAEGSEGTIVAELLDLSPFIPLSSEYGPDFGLTGGTMVLAPEGLAELGYGPDLIATLAPEFRGAYHVFYATAPDANGVADTSVSLLAVGFATPEGALAGVESFFAARPAEAVDLTRGDEGDKGYTIQFAFVLDGASGAAGIVVESGAYLADAARVVVTRTAFSGDAVASTDAAARAQLAGVWASASRKRLSIRRAPDGHPPGAAFLFGALPGVSWRPLALVNEVLPQPGESQEQLALRVTEFRNAESALGVNYLFGGDRYRVGNRIVVYPNPADGQTAIATYPDYFAELIASQGLTGERIDAPVVFGDQTSFYRFVIATDEGAVPGLTMAGLFTDLPGASAPPALLVTLSLRDQQAVAADDEVAIGAAQEVLGDSLARIAGSYDALVRSFPYGELPRVFIVDVGTLSPAEGSSAAAACETDADCVDGGDCTFGVCDDNTCEYVPVDDGTPCGPSLTCCNGTCVSPTMQGYPCNECPCPAELECHLDICEPPYPLNFGPIPTIDVAAAGFAQQTPDGWKLTGGIRCLGGTICHEVGDGFFVDLGRIFDLRNLTPNWSGYAQRSVIPDGNGGDRESIVDVVLDNESADDGYAALTAVRASFLAETGAEDFTGSAVIGDSSFVIRVPRGEGVDLDIGHVAGTMLTLQRWSDFRGQTEVKQGRELAERKLRARSDVATAIEQGQKASLANAQVFLGDPNRVSSLVNQQYTRFNGITFPILGETAAALDLRNRMDDGQDEVLNLAQPINTNDGGLVVTFDSTIRRFVDPATAPAWVANVQAWWLEATPGVLLQLAPNAPQIGQFSQSWLFFSQDETGGATLGQRFIVDSGGTIMDTRLTFSLDAALFTTLTPEVEERTVNGLNDVMSLVAGRQNEALGSVPYNGGSSVDIDRELDRVVADLEAISAAD